jgi:hypothetical protein
VLGFGGIYVREDVGGAELSRLDAALIFEELAQGCTSTAAYISIHNMAAWMIDAFGGEAQRKRFLPKLCTMQHFASYCLTEPDAGSDAASLKTKAVREGDHFVLNGAKAFISGGGVSDIYVCMVRTGAAGPKGISCIVVEKGTEGLSYGAQEQKLGWKSQPTAMVNFENCRVPAENLIGREGTGFIVAMRTFDASRPGVAAQAVGIAQGALDLAVDYAITRRQFGAPVSSFQGLRFVLADMAMKVEAARALVYATARHVDSNPKERPTIYSAMSKCFAGDVAMQVTTDAVQVFGGYGYMRDYPIEKYMRDAKITQIYEGTNQIQREEISKILIGEHVAGQGRLAHV